MTSVTTKPDLSQPTTESNSHLFDDWFDPIESGIRGRVRDFGVWSKFYRVNRETGACSWSVTQSSWVCADRTIRCNARQCGTS
jgi:hypothetical protein